MLCSMTAGFCTGQRPQDRRHEPAQRGAPDPFNAKDPGDADSSEISPSSRSSGLRGPSRWSRRWDSLVPNTLGGGAAWILHSHRCACWCAAARGRPQAQSKLRGPCLSTATLVDHDRRRRVDRDSVSRPLLDEVPVGTPARLGQLCAQVAQPRFLRFRIRKIASTRAIRPVGKAVGRGHQRRPQLERVRAGNQPETGEKHKQWLGPAGRHVLHNAFLLRFKRCAVGP